MDWIPLASTAFGAMIALGGTLLADRLRTRDEHGQRSLTTRRRAYLDFVLALGEGLQGLREVAATSLTGEERAVHANREVSRGGLYPARERFLMVAPTPLVTTGQEVFEALIEVRDAVRAGAALASPEFHDAYHPYAERMWRFRLAIRDDVGASRLQPGDLSRRGWDHQAECRVCRGRAAAEGEAPG